MNMNVKGKFKAVSKVAVVAAAGLLLATASPAAAAGGGVSTGHTNVSVSNQIQFPLCLKATATTITLTNTGTFTAGAESFVGVSEAVFSTPNDYWFSPAGTFGDAMCTTPALVAGSLSITKVSGTGTVSCGSSAATYNRVNTNAEITTATGTASCTVGGITAATVLTFAGSQQPCLSDFGVPNCDLAPESEWVGTYTQAP